MADNIVVMPGPLCFDHSVLRTVAMEFGWSVRTEDNLREAVPHANPITVLFHRKAFGACSWRDAVMLLRSEFPGALPIACHEFTESIDWPEICDAGAFHALCLPLKESEVRQSFGFVREVETRLAEKAYELHAPPCIDDVVRRVRATKMASAA